MPYECTINHFFFDLCRTVDDNGKDIVYGFSSCGIIEKGVLSGFAAQYSRASFSRFAAIERNSKAFNSDDIAVVVTPYRKEREVTGTPAFLLRSKRIAFLATKADKRRPLAWLYDVHPKRDESPGFLRYLPNVE